MKIQRKLPEDHRPYTDKYFLRTKQILEAEGINPVTSMKVFARGGGEVAGLDEAIEALTEFTDLERTGEIWVTKKPTFQNKDPLIVIKGPIQNYVELETMYLGILSTAISAAAGIALPNPENIEEKVRRLAGIYGNIPITYFGARHYHWSLDKEIAAAALRGRAVQTSTDIGSANISKSGVGTTPHVLTLALASVYGRDQATLKTTELFDKYMPGDIPRMTLVDTFNKELADSLAVAQYFGDRRNLIRLDTCGENIGEGCSLYQGRKEKDPTYQTGTGVTLELVRNIRNNLIENGYGDSTDIFLTSGFGNEDKARIFAEANEDFKEKTCYDLFIGVGVGEVSEARFCTADVFEIDGKQMYKTGRETTVDYSQLRRVV